MKSRQRPRTAEERAKEVTDVITEARGIGAIAGKSVEWTFLALILIELRRILREKARGR